MFLSVIIPTLNRRVPLFRQLRSLQQQTLADFQIIVVDNAADKLLWQDIRVFNATATHPVGYVPERQRGLMYARHTGACTATGEILVYVDDDQTTMPAALQAYAEAFAAHPEMAAAGGPLDLVWEEPAPLWLIDYINATPGMFPLLGWLDLGPAFLLSTDGSFFGGNMAIRRDVLFQVGGFNPDLIGTRCVGDGEVGLYRKLQARHLLIGYVPTALQKNYIPRERMTLAYLRQRIAYDGASAMYTRYHPHVPDTRTLLRHAAQIAAANIKYWAGGLPFYGRTDPRSVTIQLRAAETQAQVAYLLRLCWDKDLRRLVQAEKWLEELGPDPKGHPFQHG